MNDTNKESKLLTYFQKDKGLSSSEVYDLIEEKLSLITVKRYLGTLKQLGYLEQIGAGRSIKYVITKKGLMLKPFDIDKYLSQDPDKRVLTTKYQFDLFTEPFQPIFSKEELKILDDATAHYRNAAIQSNAESRKKELMRFIVEFSWKTSQIEGNTYDLISTEKLLLYGEKSPTNTQYETQMIINQNLAIEYILNDLEVWSKPSIHSIEALQGIVGDKLDISKNIRKTLVGITGTNYQPLDNEYQIREALTSLFDYVDLATNIYDKSILALLGVSYIQPFVDGNKRTSRLLANAILLSKNYTPISYRSVDDRSYKEAVLVFYEQNNVVPFKKLFIEQYLFAAKNYNLAN